MTLETKEWRERRVKLTPIFSSGKIKKMFEIVDMISDRFARAIGNELEKSDLIDLRSWSQRFTADNIGNTAFGLECNCK